MSTTNKVKILCHSRGSVPFITRGPIKSRPIFVSREIFTALVNMGYDVEEVGAETEAEVEPEVVAESVEAVEEAVEAEPEAEVEPEVEAELENEPYTEAELLEMDDREFIKESLDEAGVEYNDRAYYGTLVELFLKAQDEGKFDA